MKKALLLIVIFAVIIGRWLVGKHNNIIGYDETVNQTRSQVENVYQRRADLIPNLVETVKWYAEHEEETLTAVVEARAKATSTEVNIDDIDSLTQFQASQGELSSALAKLMVVVESYPDLKANTNFLELQAEVAGTENRISVERKRFNESVESYNQFVRRLPQNFVASMFGFLVPRPYFESNEWADIAPVIDFSDEE